MRESSYYINIVQLLYCKITVRKSMHVKHQNKTLGCVLGFLVFAQLRFGGGLMVTVITRILYKLMDSLLVNVQAVVACKFFSAFLAEKTLPWVLISSVLHQSFS